MDTHDAPLALPPSGKPPPNRYLAVFRGHGRQWKDEQLGPFFEALARGDSILGACQASGIPEATIYRHMEADPDLADAVRVIRTCDGAEAWEHRVYEGAHGGMHKHAAPYVRLALELRGRLGRRDGQGAVIAEGWSRQRLYHADGTLAADTVTASRTTSQ